MEASRQSRIDQALPEAVSRLRHEFSPIAIYQFGSSASGGAGPDSDLDLLVVVESSVNDFISRAQRAHSLMRGLGVPVDVLVYTRTEFEERSGVCVTLEHRVRAGGRLVYAA